MTVTLLDGRRLAAQRTPGLAARAGAVRQRRGRAPRLLLMAFGDAHGGAPHVRGKLRACAAAGVDAVSLIIAPGHGTPEAVDALQAAIAAHRPDAVFVQFPFPPGLDGDAISAAIPDAADVDVMTTARFDRYLADEAAAAPVTVSAALLLLDAHGIDLSGRPGVIVAGPSPFVHMFEEALRRRGARMGARIEPDAGDLVSRVRAAALVVAAAGRPGMVNTGMLTADTVAIDVGYFNEGGRGDIDSAPGTAHLAAIMPVPGGIGPMTVSALVERVIAFAGG